MKLASKAKRNPRTGFAPSALDYFMAANLAIFLLMLALSYYERFLTLFGRDRTAEFFIYAAAILLAASILWMVFRKFPVSPWALLLIQAGIFLHYAGGFVTVNGERLYLYQLFGIPAEWARFDKLVHFLNAFLGAWLLDGLLRKVVPRFHVRSIFVVLAIMGLGSGVEIVEYLAVCHVKHTGVGAYDNNMQDLIANFAGALVFALLAGLVKVTRRGLSRTRETQA